MLRSADLPGICPGIRAIFFSDLDGIRLVKPRIIAKNGVRGTMIGKLPKVAPPLKLTFKTRIALG
jgi:hypothetical protein